MNIKHITFYLLLIFIFTGCSSSSDNSENLDCGIYEGDVVFGSQFQVNEFGQCNYSEITGKLTIIDYNTSGDVVDLSPLMSLTSIGGILSISGTELTNLEGLNNLQSSGTLIISSNEFLQNLNGLESLTPSKVEISNNPLLEDISSLDIDSNSLTGIHLSNCPLITSLENFSNITNVSLGIGIENMDGLTTLNGLNNLEIVGSTISSNVGSLKITDNDNLESIDALSSVKSLVYGFKIENNNLIQNLNAFSNVETYVRGYVYIRNNPMLEDISSLTFVNETDDLSISNNGSLTNLDGLENLILVNEDLYIFDNYSLTDFCGIKNLMSNGSISFNSIITNNGADPNYSDEFCNQ